MNIGIERIFQSTDWITLVSVFVLVLIAIQKMIYPKKLQALCNCFFSKKYFLDYSNELLEPFNFFNFFLLLIQNILGALFLLFVSYRLGLVNSLEDPVLFLRFFFWLTFYFTVQIALGKLMALLFRLDEIYTSICILKFSYLKVILIILFPLLLLNLYVYPENNMVFGFTLVVAILLLVIRFFLVLKNNYKYILKGLFYFILYICILEIVPLLILGKVLIK